MKYYDIVTALEKSPCDKHGSNSNQTSTHNYGVVYDQIFNSHYLKKGEPLSILEIGIKCGHSIKIWDQCPLFNKVIGVDHTTKEIFGEVISGSRCI